MGKLLSGTMVVVFFLAMFLPFSPFVLWYFHTSRSVYSFWFASFFCLIMVEKIYAMFFRNRDNRLFSPREDWTAPAVGLVYTSLMYAVIVEYFQGGGEIVWPSVTIIGVFLYFLAIAFRYWAFYHLGRHWAVQLDWAGPANPKLIRTGPYGLIRHPLYSGACIEALAIPIIFNSFLAFLFGLFFFIPLEFKRAAFEEKYLIAVFGSDYERYTEEVGAFLPRFRRVWRK